MKIQELFEGKRPKHRIEDLSKGDRVRVGGAKGRTGTVVETNPGWRGRHGAPGTRPFIGVQFDDQEKGVVNSKVHLDDVEKIEEDLTEGMWVATSMDGVEKRFKKQEDADAWKKTTAKKVKEPVAKKPKEDKEAVLSFVWNTISTADGWGEIDAYDVVKLKIIPVLARQGGKFGDKFADAVQSARRRDGLWDKLMVYLDGAVRYAKAGKNFWDWAEEQAEFARDAMRGD